MSPGHAHTAVRSSVAVDAAGLRSALAAPAALRLAVVLGVAALLWAAVWWALRP